MIDAEINNGSKDYDLEYIRSHVNNGLQLAKEYGLPKIVSDFIPMHHGTTRVEYFYRQALEAVDGDESKIDESQFRYPGPKPDTKETGILMICEAIEAAVPVSYTHLTLPTKA